LENVVAQVVTELSQASALCAGAEEAIKIHDDIGFFQAVKAALAKKRGERKSTEDLDYAVRQLVAKQSRLKARSSTSSKPQG